MVRAWSDWKRFGLLPFGSDTLADEPAWVVEVFEACEEGYLESLKAATDG